MSEQNKEGSESGEESLESMRAEAKGLLAEIRKLKTQAEEQLKSAESSRKGADDHASYAIRFNGIADALCLAGDDLQQFEVATAVLVPKTKYFPEFSDKNLKVLLELIKTARG